MLRALSLLGTILLILVLMAAPASAAVCAGTCGNGAVCGDTAACGNNECPCDTGETCICLENVCQCGAPCNSEKACSADCPTKDDCRVAIDVSATGGELDEESQPAATEESADDPADDTAVDEENESIDAVKAADEVVTEAAVDTTEDSSFISYLFIAFVLVALAIGGIAIFGRRGKDNQ